VRAKLVVGTKPTLRAVRGWGRTSWPAPAGDPLLAQGPSSGTMESAVANSGGGTEPAAHFLRHCPAAPGRELREIQSSRASCVRKPVECVKCETVDSRKCTGVGAKSSLKVTFKGLDELRTERSLRGLITGFYSLEDEITPVFTLRVSRIARSDSIPPLSVGKRPMEDAWQWAKGRERIFFLRLDAVTLAGKLVSEPSSRKRSFKT